MTYMSIDLQIREQACQGLLFPVLPLAAGERVFGGSYFMTTGHDKKLMPRPFWEIAVPPFSLLPASERGEGGRRPDEGRLCQLQSPLVKYG